MAGTVRERTGGVGGIWEGGLEQEEEGSWVWWASFGTRHDHRWAVQVSC